MTTSNSKTTHMTRGLILTSILTSLACTYPVATGPIKYEACSPSAIAKSCDQVDRFHTGTYPEIDNIMDNFMTDNGLQGCGVGLMRGEEILYLKSYGEARVGGLGNTGADVPWDLDTFFPIASSTKTITAVMLLQMLEEGRLPNGTDLNTTIAKLLPGVMPEDHPKLGALTLNQVLSHTSGIPRSNGSAESGAISDNTYWSTDLDTIDEINQAYKAVYKPYLHPSINLYAYQDLLEDNILTDLTPVGRYNNSNYRIAASVVDYHDTYIRNPNICFMDESCFFAPNYGRAESGYEAYFRDYIATAPDAPKDMMTTMCLQDSKRYPGLPTLALGYDWTDPEYGAPVLFERNRSKDIGRQTGSTGMMATIGDYARFILAMNNGDLITDSSMVELSTPRESLLFGPYGLGAWPISRTLPVSGAATGLQGGGNKEGFSSWWSIQRPDNGDPALSMVLSCNTNVYNERVQLADDLLNKLDILLALNIEPNYNPSLATCDGAQMSQGASLMATWRDVLLQEKAHYLDSAQGNSARALQLVRADLRAEPGGIDVLNAFDRGDLELAAGLLEGVLETRRARRRAAAPRPMSTRR